MIHNNYNVKQITYDILRYTYRINTFVDKKKHLLYLISNKDHSSLNFQVLGFRIYTSVKHSIFPSK